MVNTHIYMHTCCFNVTCISFMFFVCFYLFENTRILTHHTFLHIWHIFTNCLHTFYIYVLHISICIVFITLCTNYIHRISWIEAGVYKCTPHVKGPRLVREVTHWRDVFCNGSDGGQSTVWVPHERRRRHLSLLFVS